MTCATELFLEKSFLGGFCVSFSSHVTVWGFVFFLLSRLNEFGFRRAFRNCFRKYVFIGAVAIVGHHGI